MKKKVTRLFSVLLAAVLVFGTLPVSALGTDVVDPPASTVDEFVVDESVVDESSAEPEEEPAVDDAAQVEEQSAEEEAVAVQSGAAVDGYDMNVLLLDCGRKYYSVGSIKTFIDEAHAAGFNYIQLVVGNEGLRFLLNNMSLTVGEQTYTSDEVTKAIQQANKSYNATFTASSGHSTYSPDKNELTQSEMDTIIDYAHEKSMGVIPCINSPGHMYTMLSVAQSLTGQTNYAYSGSTSRVNVSNTDATAFTQALMKKYMDYFAGKGCQYFNMGADEYDFNGIKGTSTYGDFITYMNQVAAQIKDAGMKPMAFNDGVYYNKDTKHGTVDTDIIVFYWSSGWGNEWSSGSYLPAKTTYLSAHKLINTNQYYYWALGNSTYQDAASRASGFDYTKFEDGATISNPKGSMFCVWSDFPGDGTEAYVINATASAISDFGATLPKTDPVTETPTTPSEPDTGKPTITAPDGANALKVNDTTTLEANEEVAWTAEPEGVVELASADDVATYSSSVTAQKVTVTAKSAGKATIIATNDAGKTAEFALSVAAEGTTTKNIELVPGETVTEDVADTVAEGEYGNDIAAATVKMVETPGTTTFNPVTTFAAGTYYVSTESNASKVNEKNSAELTFEKYNSNYYQNRYYISVTENGQQTYIYPNRSRSFGGYSYSLSEGQQYVTVSSGTSSGKAYVTVSKNNAYLTLDTESGSTAFDATGSSTQLYLYTKSTTEPTTSKKLLFTGGAVDEETTTTIVIGDVTYNITVKPETLASVSSLKIQYWITNREVTGSDNATGKQIAATTEGVYSSTGVALTDLVPTTGKFKDGNNELEAILWKGTRLTDGTTQTTDAGDDETENGIDFKYIRYYGKHWSYSSDQKDWHNFDLANDQIIAYYMQRTKVTDEVITSVKDYGEVPATNYNYDQGTKGNYVFVDFAVKLPSSDEITPNSFPNNKSMAFHCADGDQRTIGTIMATASDSYEVYMITLTPSDDSSDPDTTRFPTKASEVTSYTYDGTEKVVWVDDPQNIPDELQGEDKKADGYTEGGDAIVNSVSIYKRHAMRITYYLRAKKTETSLNVIYVDNATNKPFHDYIINAEGKDTTFDEEIKLDPAAEDGWKGDLLYATIKNIVGRNETVSADLSTMVEIPAKYRRANYTCVKVVRSGDGKTVTLYYDFSSDAAFVVDFGTPLTITPEQVSDNLTDAELTDTQIEAASVTCGTATATTDGVVTYTPGKEFVGSVSGDTFRVTYTGVQQVKQEDGTYVTKSDSVTYTITIYPASNVLYEESFLSKGEDDTTWKRTDAAAATQETQKVGDTTKNYNVFGYDGSYSSSTNANGVWSITGLEKNKYSTPLTTEFYGNTFDLIGDCGPTTGGVLLTVIKDGANGKHATIANIDTRYDDGSGATIHQVPLAHIVMANEKYGYDDALCTVKVYATGLDQIDGTSAVAVQAAPAMDADAEYDALLAQILEENDLTMDEVDFVTISAADTLDVAATPDAVDFYSATYASDGTGSSGHPAGTHVEIDGFRVYRSADKTDAVAANYPEKEQNVSYVNIWDAAKDSFVGFTDKKGEVTGTVQDYIANGGPQNEIYLTKSDEKSHAVVFKIGDRKSTIQVSLRAVKGTGSVTVNLGNGETKTITSVTEMYYEITSNDNGVFTIANTGDGILAIGNVKLPSDVTKITSAQDLGDDMVSKVLTAALYGNPEPDPEPDPATFAPETFETKVSSSTVIRNKVVTLKVTVSSDVAYITVNGKKYTRTGLKGFGGKNRTIRVVSVMPKDETPSFEIVAYNANGEKSETKTVSE